MEVTQRIQKWKREKQRRTSMTSFLQSYFQRLTVDRQSTAQADQGAWKATAS